MEAKSNLQTSGQTQYQFYNLAAIFVLLLGIVGVYIPRLPLLANAQGQTASNAHHVYVADLDFWRRTDRERAVTATANFALDSDLSQIPLEVGPWIGEEVPETNQEVQILLEPEQYVRRLYRNQAGQYIWLTLIGGRSSQPFHPPDICYDADGWQSNFGSTVFHLPNQGELYALWLDARKPSLSHSGFDEHVVSYFYIFPNRERILSDGIVLFKLTSGRFGAPEESLQVHEDFITHFFAGT
ncbi:MAG: exosortase-associated EpsI family protein [Caldilineaceae bacterium]